MSQRPRTSDPHPEHRIYPYLLRNLEITRPNHMCCADVTYLPMRRGFLYLVAIMDWASRKVLAWRLSNTVDAGFCVEALEDALARFGRSDEHTSELQTVMLLTYAVFCLTKKRLLTEKNTIHKRKCLLTNTTNQQ